ncbi:acetylesterase [Opitutaceae bacterium TAV5]|nr:acetylesterase [Opitutaceae bacterium TAV5]
MYPFSNFAYSVFRIFAPAMILTAATVVARADVTLPALFSDHAVLQKSPRVPVWGRATPGETVTITLDKATALATTGPDGNWRTTLDLSTHAPGPHQLVIQATNTLVVPDVLVGEVWLASGQSNMEWPLQKTTDAAAGIAASSNPRLRHFAVKKKTSDTPSTSLEGRWEIAAPETSGNFSAIAWYFGKTLQHELDTPVGLINASWGGTPIASWTSADAFARDSANAADIQRQRDDVLTFPARIRVYARAMQGWMEKYQRIDKTTAQSVASLPSLHQPIDSTWMPVTLPGLDRAAGLPEAGAIWLARRITLPPERANLALVLDLGRIDGFHTVYWNGEEAGRSTPRQGTTPFVRVIVGSSRVRTGDSILAVRIFNPVEKPGLTGGPFRAGTIPLAGPWYVRTEFSLPPLSPQQRASLPRRPVQPPERRKTPSLVYNGMIAPLIPYAIRGTIWYQGESNTGHAWQYRTDLPRLINDWRRQWGQGDFPFLVCQLANYGSKTADPAAPSRIAELREAQTLALALPHTGLATLIDLGEELDIHPRDKRTPARRLADTALSVAYGRPDAPASGPVYLKSTRIPAPPGESAGRIRIHFINTYDGLVARPLPATYRVRSTAGAGEIPLVRNAPAGSQLEGFSICGEDARWTWATACIEGDTVLVWSDAVPRPVAVRYAWADNPTCNLYSAAGLPAVPFRTDTFPVSTENPR